MGGIFLSYLVNKLLLNFSRSLGIRNKNDITIRWSNESKPSLGGISFFVVFIFSAFAFAVLFPYENMFRNISYLGLFLASCIAFVMGLADDAYNTRPLFKLFIQISCGLILVVTNTIIQFSGNLYFDAIITVFWVVLIMNSLNMLDNMDGITATVVLFILLSCLFVNLMLNGMTLSLWNTTNIAMIGAILGFLLFNIHPSQMFMGDAGSQFIGLFVAFFGVKQLWSVGGGYDCSTILSIALVLVAFTPAAVDTLTVVINRLKKGQSPMVGGKDHTTHHLVYAGLNDKKVWYVFLGVSLVAMLLTVLMVYLLMTGSGCSVVFFSIFTIVVFVYLYRNTLKYPAKKK